MKPLKPKSSAFIRSVQMARIGLSIRQKWSPFWMRHRRVYPMFRYDRQYNEWHVDRIVKDMRRKKRTLPAQIGDKREAAEG